MAFPFLNQILIFLINTSALVLGIVVYSNNKKAWLNRIFSLTILLMLLWVNFAYVPRVIGLEHTDFALRLLKIAWFVTPGFFTFLYFLALLLIGWERKYMFLNFLVGITGFSLAIVTGFTDLVVHGIRFIGTAIRIDYGPAMFIFLGGITFLIFTTLFVVFRAYKKIPVQEKRKLQYFLVGLTIFYVMNLIFNITLPIVFNIVRWYWMGDYSTIAVLGFTGYAIVKHKLFEIKVVLTAFFVVLISVLLLFDILLLTPGILQQLYKGLVLTLLIYFGYLLTRNVQKEIEDREKLQELSKAKSEFMSIASHQLRTPLSIVKGYISLMEEGSFGAPTQQQKEVLEKVFRTNEDMIRMVNNLLKVTRSEEGRLQYSFEKTDLGELVEKTAETFEVAAKEKNLSFECTIPQEPVFVNADRDKITQVISNLIDNAFKYTKKGGIKVTLYIDKTNKMATVTVQDTGLGIRKEEIQNLFSSFTRGKAGIKTWSKGVGLGLYIAKQLIEAHGGRIWAESAGEGQGSRFFVELPIQ